MSLKEQEFSSDVRGRAIGMLEAGMKQKKVAEDLRIGLRTLQYWWSAFKKTGSVLKQKRSGRPKILGRVEKIVIGKSIGKTRQSCRKLSKRMNAKELKGSKDTINRYLRKDLGVRPYHRRKIPLLTEKHVKDRLAFCKRVKNWTIEQWKQVVFSDELPFELYHSPNPKNDVIWSADNSSIEHMPVPKFSPKVMVWGAMSFSGLSELHIVPQGQTINQDYYCTKILEDNLFKRIEKNDPNGSIFDVKLVPDMSQLIFQQDGARAHTARRTQELLATKIPNFWNKAMWPPNSPDLSPIENLWSILGDKVEDEKIRPTTVQGLERVLKAAWKKIPEETLSNLISSIPSRVKAVLKAKGHFPVK